MEKWDTNSQEYKDYIQKLKDKENKPMTKINGKEIEKLEIATDNEYTYVIPYVRVLSTKINEIIDALADKEPLKIGTTVCPNCGGLIIKTNEVYEYGSVFCKCNKN